MSSLRANYFYLDMEAADLNCDLLTLRAKWTDEDKKVIQKTIEAIEIFRKMLKENYLETKEQKA